MRVANLMFGRGLGGIEQAFVDYGEGLKGVGCEVTAITHPRAEIIRFVNAVGVATTSVNNWGAWDPFAPGHLKTLIHTLRAEVVIAHGNRAITLAKKAVGGELPIAAVSHNYKFKPHLRDVDAVFAITHHMVGALVEFGVAPDRIHHVPNMIKVKPGFIRRTWVEPPVIGCLGRLVPKKGFDVMLDALQILRRQGYAFRAVIAGKGEEERHLRHLILKYGLDDAVRMPGWVDHAQDILEEIDIFCLPSHHEPFGIVLLEAMASKLPVVTTDSEGPSEIIRHGETGLVVPRGDSYAMAEALAWMLDDEGRARGIASEAFRCVRTQYDQLNIAGYITEILEVLAHRHSETTLLEVAAHYNTSAG